MGLWINEISVYIVDIHIYGRLHIPQQRPIILV